MEKGKVNMEKKDRCAGNGTAVFLCEELGVISDLQEVQNSFFYGFSDVQNPAGKHRA